ncbi:hypothetical protein B0H13DRAFT_317862 [Mycena leptocephala]|nr:hypothetical protein B0H13DRAFT_317862 [Mycena leptocephala]
MDEAGVLTVCATDASGRFTSTNTSVGGIRRGDRADSHRARRCEPQYFRRREYNMPAMRNSRRLWRISSLEGYIATRRPRTPPVSGHSGRYNTRSGCVDRTIKDAEALRDPKMILAVERLVRISKLGRSANKALITFLGLAVTAEVYGGDCRESTASQGRVATTPNLGEACARSTTQDC